MSLILNDVAKFITSKVEISNIDETNYVSTENMLPNKGGVDLATSLPDTKSVREYLPNDILINNIRPYFKKIWFANKEGGCSNDVFVLRANENYDSKFLYYVLSSDDFFSYVMANAKGTKMPRGDKKAIQNYPVPDFSIEDQMKISQFLSKIDEKIEINKKINHNLAEIILSNFRRWFVHFEPFKEKSFIDSDFGFIPENWKVGSIGDYCKLKSGFAFKSAWWQDKGIKVIKIKDINQDSIDLSDCSCVSSDKLLKAAEFKVVGGDLLIAMTGATIGKFSIVPKHDEPLYVNQRVGKFFLGDEPSNKLPFIWSLLKQKRIFDEIINRGQGSAQPNVSPTDIETIEIILPPNEVINQFNNEYKSMFELMINNAYEITKLNKIRDTLLPKLMSGEVDVSKINCDLNR